jgi:hypothetical protein
MRMISEALLVYIESGYLMFSEHLEREFGWSDCEYLDNSFLKLP